MNHQAGQHGGLVQLPATVVRGYGVASGAGAGAPYPEGTIRLQRPYFLERGLDLSGYYPGTLNLRVGRRLRLTRPRYRFSGVRWTDRHGPENFSFSPCLVEYRGVRYRGLIYVPHPSTKPEHYQDPDVVEVIAHWIGDIASGATVRLHVDAREVTVV